MALASFPGFRFIPGAEALAVLDALISKGDVKNARLWMFVDRCHGPGEPTAEAESGQATGETCYHFVNTLCTPWVFSR